MRVNRSRRNCSGSLVSRKAWSRASRRSAPASPGRHRADGGVRRLDPARVGLLLHRIGNGALGFSGLGRCADRRDKPVWSVWRPHLHRLTDSAPEAIPVLVPTRGGAPRVSGPWRFQRERPGARLPRTVGYPPRLAVEDTVLDLACGPDADVKAMVTGSRRRCKARLTTPERLRRAAAGRHFQRHRRLLYDLLADVGLGVRSPLELGYLRKVERPHQLPAAMRQVRRRGTEVDVCYEEFGLLVELDGRLGHAGLGRFWDMRRDNRATTDGLATLRYGRSDVFWLPGEVAREVGVNLVRRRWELGPGRCDSCRRA